MGKQLLQSSSVTQTTTVTNVSNYFHGINGLVFDVNYLATATLTAADFIFRIHTNTVLETANPFAWAAAPNPAVVSVTPGFPSRIRLEWANNAIQNTWLQVILKANTNTGLTAPAVFYVGHVAGEGTLTAPYRVGAPELSAIQVAISSEIRSITDVRDVDKSRRVGATDLSFVQSRLSATVVLNNIIIPVGGSTEEGTSPPPAFGSLLLANESSEAIGAHSTPPVLLSSAATGNKLQPIKTPLFNASTSLEVGRSIGSKRTSNASPDNLIKSIDDFFHEFGRLHLLE